MHNRELCPKSCTALELSGKCLLKEVTKAVVRAVPPLKEQTPISNDPLDYTEATVEASMAHEIIAGIHVLAKELGCTKKINPNYPGRSRL